VRAPRHDHQVVQSSLMDWAGWVVLVVGLVCGGDMPGDDMPGDDMPGDDMPGDDFRAWCLSSGVTRGMYRAVRAIRTG
jgi:hypothetical protein